ncbi:MULTISPECIES: hypothetical protein [unclassified Corallococcus]|uniref:hypothetical protein n=1 Tax=unclassified Corallococcus TaxID=2685029 RepID=UPI001A8FF01E|nr:MULTISPECIES: hypothetical protein [unclassified Corallococcus]MBN9687099.1 hypothetical protein [Corallococcus sp. NCSPR001]WAS89073.1 hypothetical protein O0N60_19325 [Corallococcus sp. NCRR]
MEATAIVVPDAPAPRALITRDVLKYEAEQRKLLAEYVKGQMVAGTDFGVIPGTPKPTLLKPGAEKLVTLFRCTPKFTLMEKQSTQDFERGFFNYVFRCRIFSRDADAVVAEGFGSANSYESRYRWRNAARKCPGCGKEAIIQGKAEYGGGWLCFKKKDGCGAKFNADDTSITGQQVGRVENPDLPDMANTVLKMTKKRALVDASIALARCSDMFTQDVEDFGGDAPPEDLEPPPGTQKQAKGERRSSPAETSRTGKPTAEAPAAKPTPGGPEDVAAAIVAEAEQARTADEVKALSARARKLPTEPLKRAAADALQAAVKRLGIEPAKKAQPAPEPGAGG